MPKKKTKEEFIKDARKVHGDKYDYSKVEYVNSATKVCIICPDHGEFWQKPNDHLNRHGCTKCGGNYSPTKEEWIASAHKKHCNKYDYSKVEYVNCETKVCIICPEHGKFWQTPHSHTQGFGCPKCGIETVKSKLSSNNDDFIAKCKEVHGEKYNYSKIEYVNKCTKVCIICPEHGEFWQTPNNHIKGSGCPKCVGHYVLTKEEWIASARKVHGDKYDYSKVNYVNGNTKVCIICPNPNHGEFWQTPSAHTQGNGCPKCGVENRSEKNTLTKEIFIKKATEIHGDKYDYSKVVYVCVHTKVCIICPKHGEFCQEANTHLRGASCPKCANEANAERCRYSKDDFIKKARKVHSNKYDYSKVEYIGALKKVCIKCPEHGEFWQVPSAHLQGQGCSKCNLSHLERSVMNYLDNIGITYDYQKHFSWLGRQSLDFYLPDYKVGIECQGGQHFFPVERFGGEDGFKQTLERDKKKKALCDKHGVKLLYFGNVPNYDTFLGEVVHDDVQDLIDYLQEHKIDRDKPTTE